VVGLHVLSGHSFITFVAKKSLGGWKRQSPKDELRPSAVPEAEAEESFLSEEMATLRVVESLVNNPQEDPASS